MRHSEVLGKSEKYDNQKKWYILHRLPPPAKSKLGNVCHGQQHMVLVAREAVLLKSTCSYGAEVVALDRAISTAVKLILV